MNSPTKINLKAKWIRFRAAGYLKGKGITFAGGSDPVFNPPAQDRDKFSLAVDTVMYSNLDASASDLNFLSNNSFDHVFIGPRILDFPDPAAQIRKLADKLTIGGHIILHIPIGVGRFQQEVNETLIREWVGGFAHWREKALYNRDSQLLGIFKLINRSSVGVEPPPAPSGRPRACIARYGAIGDMIMISPLIKQLHADGYEITMNVTPYCAEVIKHNPYISNIVLQEREIIPNADLGAYWQEWVGDYDKYINLSESIEGKLLKVEGRRDYFTSQAWRMETCGTVNYYDQTMRLGGYPEIKGTKGELHFSNTEEKQVKHFVSRFKDNFFILWGLRGSSFHKCYPLLEPVLCDWLDKHPDAKVMLAGGPGDKQLEFQHPQVLCSSGELPLREVFCMTKYADLVVGPESAIINAAACFPTRKVVFLSHSSEYNLCAYWDNYTALAPENIPCYPCHQLHYTKPSCPQISIIDPKTQIEVWQGPACAGMGVTGERLQATLDKEYALWQAQRA